MTRRLMMADRLAKIANELVEVAPGAPWMLKQAAGLPLDSATSQPLGLDGQLPTTPEGSES